jgi:hypothetical protein
VQTPLLDALKPDALESLLVYAKGKQMLINRRYEPILDSTGGESKLFLPINSFPVLSGLPDKANARVASNQGVESNFSLTAQNIPQLEPRDFPNDIIIQVNPRIKM